MIEKKQKKDKKYYEFNAEEVADEELSQMDLIFDAQKVIREMAVEDQEAIARVLWKSKVSKMTSGEMKRDLLVYSKSPKLHASGNIFLIFLVLYKRFS